MVGTPVPRSAAVSLENGVTHASGNQSARASVIPVCSLTQRARSASVKRLASSFVLGDASGKRHRLEADAGDGVDVLDGAAHNVADLMIVNALHDGRHEDDLHAGGAAVLDDLHLGVEQRPSASAKVNVVGDAVELQVQRGQPAAFAFFANSRLASSMPLVAA